MSVTRRGLEHARRLRERLRRGDLYRPARYGPPAHSGDHLLKGGLAAAVPELFARYDQIVFFLAVGAVTRLVAPCLRSKGSDPGVLAVDETGAFVVPVVSGHAGGANAFARTVAGCLGAVPVVTTASDLVGGPSLDLLADELGWTAEPAARLKDAARALIDGEPVAIVQEVGNRGGWLDERTLPAGATFAHRVDRLPDTPFAAALWITDRVPEELGGLEPDRIVWFRPRSLVLGVGCERGISLEALEDGLARFLAEHRFARASLAGLASLDLKADEPALIALAERSGWETAFFTAAELAEVEGIATPSPTVERCVGVAGVAEPSALRAAGADRLLVAKHVLTSEHSPRRMTFALARRAEFRDAAGDPGRVVFLGAGPGDPALLTLKARDLLARADLVVYAGSLVPEGVLRHAPATATILNSAHLTLEETTATMVAAARAGRLVARLHSGDPSLYGAIQEQMTALDAAGIAYDVVPGVSAFQAAAAALKTELTLPEVSQTVILTRGAGITPMPRNESLAALARHGSTLCLFLSARLGESVQAELLTAYPPETPIALAYRVSWPDEAIVTTELQHLAATLREQGWTRTTLILVGPAVGHRGGRSRLYEASHGHIFRKRTKERRRVEGDGWRVEG